MAWLVGNDWREEGCLAGMRWRVSTPHPSSRVALPSSLKLRRDRTPRQARRGSVVGRRGWLPPRFSPWGCPRVRDNPRNAAEWRCGFTPPRAYQPPLFTPTHAPLRGPLPPTKNPPRKAHSQAGRVKGARGKQVSVVIPHLVNGNKLLVLVHRIHKPIPAVYAA